MKLVMAEKPFVITPEVGLKTDKIPGVWVTTYPTDPLTEEGDKIQFTIDGFLGLVEQRTIEAEVSVVLRDYDGLCYLIFDSLDIAEIKKNSNVVNLSR